jgi:uncharacterized protein (DUF1810 family)
LNYKLERFKIAQDNCYTRVLEEIKNGKKESHWMWYIFPQIVGLGQSDIAKIFEISTQKEAEYYLTDELLSKRLVELTNILAYQIESKTPEEIFGFPDCLKFHSSMTLFYLVVIMNDEFKKNKDFFCFEDAIRKYYDCKLDGLTLKNAIKTKFLIKENSQIVEDLLKSNCIL